MKSTLIVGIGASLLTAGIAKAQQRQDITPRTGSPRTVSASPTLTQPPLPVRPPDIPC